MTIYVVCVDQDGGRYLAFGCPANEENIITAKGYSESEAVTALLQKYCPITVTNVVYLPL